MPQDQATDLILATEVLVEVTATSEATMVMGIVTAATTTTAMVEEVHY